MSVLHVVYIFSPKFFCHVLYFQARGYAAQASAKVASKKNLEVETTTLPNKLVVASVESNSPISRVSVLFRWVIGVFDLLRFFHNFFTLVLVHVMKTMTILV